MKLQVTLFSTTGKYKPVSTIVNVESMEYYKGHKREIQKTAIENICHQRYTTWNELKQNGYTQLKVREYDLEKIALQKKVNQIRRIAEQRQQAKDQDC
jgi:hypothetical protein